VDAEVACEPDDGGHGGGTREGPAPVTREGTGAGEREGPAPVKREGTAPGRLRACRSRAPAARGYSYGLMPETVERFPLFPLGLVLIPHELVPLHIFEERYKLMIGECIDEEREFGIVWLADDGLKEIGCSARITRVLERFEDGRMNVLVEGSSPFRLLRRIEDLPYPAGDVELLEDAPDGGAVAPEADTARRRYADLVAEVTDERPEPDDLAKLDAYGMAATLDVALEAKQMLLELRSERGRLEQLEGLFAEALARIRHAERAAERARGNGSVRG
jgi:Lon protease-like protein